MKVALCVPARDTVHTVFARSLANITAYLTKHNIDYSLHFVLGTVIANSRTQLVNEALEENADYVLWLDSDMHIPSTILKKLSLHNKDIVACTYSTRYKPYNTVAFMDFDNPPARLGATKGLHEVFAVGMGCMLVKTDVYKNLPKPWFNHAYNEELDDFSGEDIWFCKLAKEHGYKVYVDCDTSNLVAHVGTKAFKLEDIQ
jgi:hypothetical protein